MNSEYIIQQLYDERNQLKKDKDDYYKSSQFAWKIVIEIANYLRNNPVKEEYKFLYDIYTTFFKDCGVKNPWSKFECFAMPYFTKNEKIYNDPFYNYNRPNEKEEVRSS